MLRASASSFLLVLTFLSWCYWARQPPATLQDIQRKAGVYQARLFVAEAEKAKQACDYAHARDLYIQAVNLDPTNAAAIEGRNLMLEYLGQSFDQQGLPDIRIGSVDRCIFDFNSALCDLADDVAKGDFAAAEAEYAKATAAADSNPGIFSQKELRTMSARLADARHRLDKAKQAAAAKSKAE